MCTHAYARSAWLNAAASCAGLRRARPCCKLIRRRNFAYISKKSIPSPLPKTSEFEVEKMRRPQMRPATSKLARRFETWQAAEPSRLACTCQGRNC